MLLTVIFIGNMYTVVHFYACMCMHTESEFLLLLSLQDETVHFPLPSFEAFKRTPHVLVEAEDRERRSSESSIISDLSGGTLSVTRETLCMHTYFATFQIPIAGL